MARERRRAERQAAKNAPPPDPGPLRPFASRAFAPTQQLPGVGGAPQRLQLEDVTDPRAGPLVLERGYVSGGARRLLSASSAAPVLSQGLREAASKGRKGAAQQIWRSLEREAAATREAMKHGKPPPVGSVKFNDQELRRAFKAFDLDKNEFVGAKELKHLFAQLGEMPKDSEIDGMIALCDTRGDGAVSFEDFLGIFSSPAESLDMVDVKHLQEVVNGEEVESEPEESEDEEESESESGSGSTLSPKR